MGFLSANVLKIVNEEKIVSHTSISQHTNGPMKAGPIRRLRNAGMTTEEFHCSRKDGQKDTLLTTLYRSSPNIVTRALNAAVNL